MPSGPPVIPIRRLLLADPPPGSGRRRTSPATLPFTGSFVAAETANPDDYTLETVDASHFIIDERPDLVRARLIALAEESSA
jgi:hypothetical protein